MPSGHGGVRVSQRAPRALGRAGKVRLRRSAAAPTRRRLGLGLEEDQPFLSRRQNPAQSESILIAEASADRRPREQGGSLGRGCWGAGVGWGAD